MDSFDTNPPNATNNEHKSNSFWDFRPGSRSCCAVLATTGWLASNDASSGSSIIAPQGLGVYFCVYSVVTMLDLCVTVPAYASVFLVLTVAFFFVWAAAAMGATFRVGQRR